MRRRKPVRVPRPSWAPLGSTTVDVTRRSVLAHGDHATAGIDSIAEAARHVAGDPSVIQVNTGTLAVPAQSVGGVEEG